MKGKTVFIVAMLIGLGMTVNAKPRIGKASFGKTAVGKAVEIYTLTNSKGIEAKIITYGGSVVTLKVPDKKGNLGDVVLGFDSVPDYEKQASYIGALIGRYGNRIAKGKFTLGGKEYTLAKNNGENHLHGGPSRAKGRHDHQAYDIGLCSILLVVTRLRSFCKRKLAWLFRFRGDRFRQSKDRIRRAEV